MARNRIRTHRAFAAAVAVMATTGGCSSQAPCLQYQPHTYTRTIALRGHGAVEVSEEALVCSLRATDAHRLLDTSP